MKRLLTIGLGWMLLPVSICGQQLLPDLKLNSRSGLRQNTVWSIAEDSLGRIWLGMPGGLQVFNGSELLETGVNSGIFNLCASRDYVFGSYGTSLFRLDVQTLDTLHKEFPKALGNLELNDDGMLRISFGQGETQILNANLEKQTSWTASKESTPQIDTMACGPYLICSNSSAVWFPFEADSIIELSLVREKLQLSPERALFTTQQGILELAYDGNSLQTYRHFTDERIEQIHLDNAQNLWVGTTGDGLYRITAPHWQTRYFPVVNERGKRVACWSFFEAGDQLYNATSQGLFCLGTDKLGLVEATKGKLTISGAANPNVVLVGTADQGVYRWKDNRLEHVYFNPEAPTDNTIIALQRLNHGFVAASKTNLSWWDESGTLLRSVPYAELGIGPYIMHISPVEGGYLASAVSGCYRMNDRFELEEVIDDGTIHVSSMTLETDSGLYVVSMNDGMLKQTAQGFKQVALQEEQLFGIVEAGKAFWISGVGGLFRMTPDGIWKLGPEAGMPLDEYNQCGMYLWNDSLLYASGVGGMVQVNTAQLAPADVWPTVRISQLDSNSSSLPPLEYDQGEMVVQLECITAQTPDGFEMLAVHQGDTTEFRKSTDLLLHVPYGQSDLEILIRRSYDGATLSKVYSAQRAAPFWSQWWFWGIIALLLTALIVGLYSVVRFLQTRRLLRSEQAEKRVTEERLRISRELHDNIGARLTHIISSLDVEMYQRKEAESLSNINAFARQTMSQLRETIWAVSDRTVFFSEFATRVEQYASESRRLTGIEVKTINRVRGDFELNPVQTINFFRIIQEAINNALKYAAPSVIHVELDRPEPGYVRFVIRDDGAGFDPENVKGGTGLEGIRNRSTEAGGTCTIESAPGKGTRISVSFRHE